MWEQEELGKHAWAPRVGSWILTGRRSVHLPSGVMLNKEEQRFEPRQLASLVCLQVLCNSGQVILSPWASDALAPGFLCISFA